MFSTLNRNSRGVKAIGARGGKGGRARKGGVAGAPLMAGPVMMVLCVAALPAEAGPRGERVVRGEASFHRQGRNTTINAGDRAIIEYDSFNIGRRQTVEFVQPNAGARVLNRITGADPTSIRGTLKSNGIVYIVNPAGVIFGPNSVVDVGGIYAAAATITDQDFISGNNHFTNVQGRVVNHGSINADSTAALIGRRVANFGTVVADTGTVTMVAGDEVWIGERGGHVYARFSTDEARARAGGVANHGTIIADQVLAGVGDYFALALFEPGAVRARIVEVRGGRGTTTQVAGVIDVSNHAAGGVGGSVTVTGERVALRGATIDASGDAGGGSVRVGGDYQGRGDLPTAERTYVAPGTTINADAVNTGDGGRVIVWSDVFTNYNGSITARGGSQGGDGGFAEVSGKDVLAFRGTANLSATEGAAGELLLDPKNITIENGGADPVATNNEFGEDPTGDASMDADLITAITNTGTAVSLQASNDIVIDEDIISNNAGGDGGDITLQAGRSVEINASITTDNGDLTITANETVANGVVNAQRDAGAAVIDMANSEEINAGTGNVSMTISTGAGLTNSTSGNITVEEITTTGTVTLTNNGPTAASSIVIDGNGGNASLITAGNLALSVGGAGGGGSIGASGDEISFTATNIEASGQSGGIFLDTTGGVNVGGASGGLTGLSTTADGDIELTATVGITTTEAIAGSDEVTLTGATVAADADVTGENDVIITGPLTITGSRTISAGAGQLDIVNTVTLATPGATVTFAGSAAGATDGITFQDTVTPDAGGSTIELEFGDTTTDFGVATGAAGELISAGSLGQLQDGFDAIFIGSANGSQNITVGAVAFTDPTTIRTPTAGNINVSGAITGSDDASITLDAGAASRVLFNTAAAVTTAGDDVTILAALRIGENIDATIDSAGGDIVFGGAVDGTTGGGDESLTLDAGAGNIDFQTTASAVSGAGGAADATGLSTLTITDATNIDLQSVLISGVFSTTNPAAGAVQAVGAVNAGTIDLDADSFDFDAAVTGGAGGVVLVSTNAVNFDSTLTAGAGGVNITGAALTFDGLVSTSGGGDVTLDGAAITLTGGITTAGAAANVAITNSGVLDIDGDITANGTFTQTDNGGTVSLGADIDTSGADGAIQFNSAVTATTGVTLNAGDGAIDLNSTFAAGANNIVFETNNFQPFVADSITGTGEVTLRPEDVGDSIDLGAAATGATSTYSLADLAALADGFSLIRIGHQTTGAHTVNMAGFNGGAALRDDMVIHAPAGAGQITLLDDLDVGAEDLTFDGPFLAGAALDIDTNTAGSVTFNETADFQAFDVSLTGNDLPTFTGAVSGSGTLTVRPDAVGDAIDIGDVVAAGGALQGGLVVTQGDLQDLNDADFAAIEFGFAVTGAHSIQIADTTGATAFNSDVILHAPAGAGLITVLADQSVDTAGNANATGDLTFDGDVTIATDGTVITAEDLLTFEAGLDLDGNDTTLASADLAFNGGANSVVNSAAPGDPATLSLSPADDAADIDIGTLGGNARPGAWSLDTNDLDAIDASIGSLGFGNAATGTHLIFVGAIAALNFDAQFNAPGAGGEVRLFDNITTGGTSLTFNGDVRINNTANVTIDTGGGDVAFNNDVFGSTTGAGETLTVDAGAGDITVDGFIAGQSTGVSNSTGLTAITLTGNDISVNAVDITGALAADNAGTLDLADDVDADGGFAQTNSTVSLTSAVTLSGDITTVNTGISFASDVTLTGDSALSSGTAALDIGAALTFDTAGNNLTLASRDIDILGTITGGDGTNTLTIVPDAVGTDIEIGTGTSGAAGALVLSATDIGNIDDGFGGIVIGFAGTGAHDFEIGGAGFTDPLTLNAPAAGGSFTVLAGRTLSGTDDASLTFNGSHSTLTLNNGSRITTAGTDIDIDDDILLTDGAGDSGVNADIPLISTGAGAGNITIDGSIRGTDSGTGFVERLRIQAGTGTLTIGDVLTVNGTGTNIFGALNGIVEEANTEGLVDFSIVSASGVTLEGVNIAGVFESETALTGGFTANEAVAAQSITFTGTSFDFADGFAATNNGGGAASFTNSGTLTTTTGEAATDLTITGDTLFAAGGGSRSLIAGGTLTIDDTDTNAQDVTLSGAEINFTGGANSITGGGALSITPDDNARDINIGTPTAGNPGATSLDLTDADLAAIDDGFDSVTIGVSGGTHDLVFGSSTFRNATIFNYQAGTASIDDDITGAGNASFEFLGGDSGGTTLSADITTAGGGILIDDNVTLGADAILNNGAAGAGTIEIDGTLDGPFAFTAIGNDGAVEIDGTIGGSTALASLALSGDSVTLGNGIGTPGAAGVTGVTAINAITSLTLGGETFNTNEAFYQTQGTGTILGNGPGTTATFITNGNDITFGGGGAFTIANGVEFVINSGGGTINLGAGLAGSAGGIVFSGPVLLTEDTQITNTGNTAADTITFQDTVDGGFDLEVTTAGGDILFQGDIGTIEALANLNVESAAGVELANIGASGAPGVEGNATIVASSGDIAYNGTLYSVGSATLAANGQHSVVAGATTFEARGGDLTFAGGDIVLTNGADLTVLTDGGDATLTAIRGDSDEDVTVDLANGTGFFEGIGLDDEIGDISLTLGNVALNGNIFGNTFLLQGGSPARSIEIAGDNSTPQAVRISRAEFNRIRPGFTSVTFGRADATNAIVVGGDGGGAIAFADPLTLISPASSSTISILEDLTGGTGASLTLTGTDGTIFLGGDITTQGEAVAFDGSVLLSDDVAIATDGGDVTFGTGDTGSIDSSDNGTFALDVDAGAGAVSVEGDIGTSGPLSTLTLTGATIALVGAETEGNQSFTGETTLAGVYTAADGAILVDGDLTLATDVSISAGVGSASEDADATFTGTIDGSDNSLTVATGEDGTADFQGAVSGVETIGVAAGTINLLDVTTTLEQNFAADTINLNGDLQRNERGGITLAGDTVLTGDSSISTVGGDEDNDITLDGDLDGAFDLLLAASGGNIEVSGAIGSGTRLGDLTIGSAGDVTLQSATVGNLIQSTGTGQTVFNGTLDSNGDSGVIVTSGSFIFDGDVSVDNDLSVTSSQVTRFNAPVTTGAEVSLLGGSFRIGNDVADTFTVGGSMLVNSTGNLIVSAPVSVAGDQGADLNMVDFVLSADLSVDGGDIAVTNAGDFTLEESGSITLNGGNFRQDGTGESFLANAISGQGSNISFDGDVVMTDDLTFQGRSLAFNGRIDSDDTRRGLVLNSGGPVTLGGNVGARSRLASLTTNRNGQTRLSADVFTAGAISLGDDVVLQGGSRLDASDGGAAGTIEFFGTINSEAVGTPHTLTVITDVDVLDHTLPTITFHQSIGGDAPLDNLFLNFDPGELDGRAGLAARDITINGFTIPNVVTPLVPTIVVPFIEFDPNAPQAQREFQVETAGDFRMGQGEKLSVTFDYDVDPDTGRFVLDSQGRHFVDGVAIDPETNAPAFVVLSGGDAIFGDVTVDGNFRVGAVGDIQFQDRADAVILPRPLPGQDEDTFPGDPSLLPIDQGTDVVVNGIAAFNKGPSAPAGTFLGTPFFAQTIAAGDTGDLVVLQLQSDVFDANDFFIPAQEAGNVLGLSSFLFLDIRAEGSTNQQPPIFGQVPNESQSGTVQQATAIGSVAKRALADLNINARDPEDLLDGLIGRALYNDLAAAEGDASYVTANRMSLDIATDLVAEYNAFFSRQQLDENGNPMFDVDTGEPLKESRAPEIRAGLAAALEDYLVASGTRFEDPVAFRSFLRSTPEHAQAEDDLETLARLLRKFQILGLSSGEFAQARLALVRLVKPAQGITDQQFIAVIDAGEQGPIVPPPTDDVPIEADPAFQDVLDQQSPAGTAGTP